MSNITITAIIFHNNPSPPLDCQAQKKKKKKEEKYTSTRKRTECTSRTKRGNPWRRMVKYSSFLSFFFSMPENLPPPLPNSSHHKILIFNIFSQFVRKPVMIRVSSWKNSFNDVISGTLATNGHSKTIWCNVWTSRHIHKRSSLFFLWNLPFSISK